jgi:hypothetical protein
MTTPDPELVARIRKSALQHVESLKEVDFALLIERAGVRQAEDLLRKALDTLKLLLDNNEDEAAADLGYSDISSNYIFLQRTLGGLKLAALNRSSAISDIAADTHQSHETVTPYVLEFMYSIDHGIDHTKRPTVD